MKLMYRGIPYEAFSMDELPKAEQPSRQGDRQSTNGKVQLRRPSAELTYRGVRYTR